MARLKFKSTRPPRGFFFIESSTRLRIEGEDYGTLMKKVMEHRQYRGLPRATRPEVEEDVERQICSRLTVAECRSEGPLDELRPVTESQVLSVGQVMALSKATFDWLASGAQVVSMELLKKRQEACLSCALNNPVKACSCSLFYKTIDRLVPAERRLQDMHVCGACGCSTNAKAQMPLSMIAQADAGRNIPYPIGCWVRSENELAAQAAKGQNPPA